MRAFIFFLIVAIAQATASAQQTRNGINNTNSVNRNDASSSTNGGGQFKRRVVQQGIAIEFSMQPINTDGKQTEKMIAGDYFTIRFSMTDVASGNPVTGARPAAWMNLRSPAEKAEQQNCMKKVAAFINGSILTHPTIDLNAYYVLGLNHDGTITVVDPLYGFGGSKLLALITLKSAGEDWALTSDKRKLFVSLPDSNQVAVIDSASWKLISNIDIGPNPTRIALGPDESLLWVTYGNATGNAQDSGVAIVSASDFKVLARIPTGRGAHKIAFSSDNRFAFVTNRDEATVSVIDAGTRKKLADVRTTSKPYSIAFSKAANLAYVTSDEDGSILAVSGSKLAISARIKAEPGIGEIKFAPGDRFAFVTNPEKNLVHIVDVATNRIAQTADIDRSPDQIVFSSKLAYIRRRASETVMMIPLDQIGASGRPVPVVDFPGGQNPLGKTTRPSLADQIVQAPRENAVLVANPTDKAIYYYREGMAAPMGSFNNYSREPRAVLVVDRSLAERGAGIYETTAKVTSPGNYDVVFFLDSPKASHCFDVSVEPNPELADRQRARPAVVQHLIKDRTIKVGAKIRLQFKLADGSSKEAKTGLKDVRVLVFLAPGIWQKRETAVEVSEGIYEIEFTPPEPGVYFVYVASLSIGLQLSNSQHIALEAKNDL